LRVKVGDKVSQGTALLILEPAGDRPETGPKASAAASDGAPSEASAPAAVEGALQAEPPPTVSEEPPVVESDGAGEIYASPSVRRLARERAIDLTQVRGTGRKGRITKDDVERAGTGAPAAAPAGTLPGLDLAPWPSLDFSKQGPVERVERSRIQKISGPNLARNWVMIPHVTHNDEADITELESWRKELNAEQEVKVTMVAFLAVASVAALKEFPTFN